MASKRTAEQEEESARRAAHVMAARRRGVSFEEIGKTLGVTRQRAHQIYVATLRDIPATEVAEYRAEQAERLDELLREAYAVLGRDHVTVSNGKVVRMGRPFVNDDGVAEVDAGRGEVVLDDGPKLQAIRTILDIEARRAKLFGLDTPVRQELALDGALRYEIVGINPEDLK
jgi:hypothetical protein